MLWLDLIVVRAPARVRAHGHYELRRRRASLILAEQLRGGLDRLAAPAARLPAGAYSPNQAAYEPSPPPDEKEPKKEGEPLLPPRLAPKTSLHDTVRNNRG